MLSFYELSYNGKSYETEANERFNVKSKLLTIFHIQNRLPLLSFFFRSTIV